MVLRTENPLVGWISTLVTGVGVRRFVRNTGAGSAAYRGGNAARAAPPGWEVPPSAGL